MEPSSCSSSSKKNDLHSKFNRMFYGHGHCCRHRSALPIPPRKKCSEIVCSNEQKCASEWMNEWVWVCQREQTLQLLTHPPYKMRHINLIEFLNIHIRCWLLSLMLRLQSTFRICSVGVIVYHEQVLNCEEMLWQSHAVNSGWSYGIDTHTHTLSSTFQLHEIIIPSPVDVEHLI